MIYNLFKEKIVITPNNAFYNLTLNAKGVIVFDYQHNLRN